MMQGGAGGRGADVEKINVMEDGGLMQVGAGSDAKGAVVAVGDRNNEVYDFKARCNSISLL